MGMKKAYRAFTLIELLVVIAIIALLLSIVIPSVSKAKDYAKRTICMSNMRQTGIGVMMYTEDNDGHVIYNHNTSIPWANNGKDSVADASDPATMPLPYHSYICYNPTNTLSNGKYRAYHLGVLYDQGYVEIPEIFYCPSQPRTTASYAIPYYYDFYIGAGNPSDYHSSSPSGNYDWGEKIPVDTRPSALVRSSFNYWVYGQKQLNRIAGYKPIIVDNIQEWEVVPHRKSRGADSNPQGLSSFYADGHVTFCNDDELFEDQYWPKDYSTVGNGPGNNRGTFEQILKLLNGQ